MTPVAAGIAGGARARLEALLERAVREGAFPGAVMLVRAGGELAYLGAVGWRSLEPQREPMTVETVFDVASLTKPLATTTAVMRLIDGGLLDLEMRLAEMLGPEAVPEDKRGIRLRDLLSHCAGLPAWLPLYRELMEGGGPARDQEGRRRALARVVRRILEEPLAAPPGESARYSDLGFILLGAVVERAAGRGLDRFCEEEIFRPLDLPTMRFRPLPESRETSDAGGSLAATERCSWRKRVLLGEVHDDNAWAMGGVAGHAGLFSDVADIDRLLCALRRAWLGMAGEVVRPETVRRFWRPDGRVPDSTWRLGWDGPAAMGSAAGRFFGPESVGHLGFTGVSVWLDPAPGNEVVLLTNRIHPTRANEAISRWRPLLHDAAADLWRSGQ